MSFTRSELRAAFAAYLKGKTDAEERVSNSRSLELDDQELKRGPHLGVYSLSYKDAPQGAMAFLREESLGIQGDVIGPDGAIIATRLDDLQEQVRDALFSRVDSPIKALRVKVLDVACQQRFETASSGSFNLVLRVQYRVDYTAAPGAIATHLDIRHTEQSSNRVTDTTINLVPDEAGG